MPKVTEEEKETKSNGRFQWIVFVVFIPLLFAITIALVVMTVAGINVFEKAQSIPFISKVLPSDTEENQEQLENRIISLQATIEDKEAKISQLQNGIDGSEKDNEKLQATIEQQKLELEELRQIGEENKRAFKEVVSTFESMSAKSAAPVLLKMDDQEAIKILSSIKPDNLADILEKMPPEDAARLTGLLSADES
ncbi:MotE family protein [Bacillus haikouensis]|jgi:flagellar motility protein MotE (MotC chaperone)|uniref:MotE family protein n=1 Tax=Bacillus haikouensis TaxID=1510468 RepID=UPI00155527CB|nr:MotE family protein [Bacillus haikouensis]NQD65695.1 MotE family protein [Bacillus haikouensis]